MYINNGAWDMNNFSDREEELLCKIADLIFEIANILREKESVGKSNLKAHDAGVHSESA
jgi:hypothetical protein